jgi:hypothetical protein
MNETPKSTRDAGAGLSLEDAINGLKHLADDHPCCRVFVEALITTLQKYEGKCDCGGGFGWTTIKCCNICGKPIPSEQWHINPNVRDHRSLPGASDASKGTVE